MNVWQGLQLGYVKLGGRRQCLRFYSRWQFFSPSLIPFGLVIDGMWLTCLLATPELLEWHANAVCQHAPMITNMVDTSGFLISIRLLGSWSLAQKPSHVIEGQNSSGWLLWFGFVADEGWDPTLVCFLTLGVSNSGSYMTFRVHTGFKI